MDEQVVRNAAYFEQRQVHQLRRVLAILRGRYRRDELCQEPATFSNESTSCIQCGICITVCPMDVLSFNNDGQGTVSRKLFGPDPDVGLTVEGNSLKTSAG